MGRDQTHSGRDSFSRYRPVDDYDSHRQRHDSIGRQDSRTFHQRDYDSYRGTDERPYVDTSGRRYHRSSSYQLVADKTPVTSPAKMDNTPVSNHERAPQDPRLAADSRQRSLPVPAEKSSHSETRVSQTPGPTTKNSATKKPLALGDEMRRPRSPERRKAIDHFNEEKESPSRPKSAVQSPIDSPSRPLNVNVPKNETKQYHSPEKNNVDHLRKNTSSDFGAQSGQDFDMEDAGVTTVEKDALVEPLEEADLIHNKMRKWVRHASILVNLGFETDKSKKSLSRLQADEESHIQFPSHRERDIERRHREEKRASHLAEKIQQHESHETTVLTQIVAQVFVATNQKISTSQSELDALRSDVLQLRQVTIDQATDIKSLKSELAVSKKLDFEHTTTEMDSIHEALREFETNLKKVRVDQGEIRSQIEHGKTSPDVEKLSESLKSLRENSVDIATYKDQYEKVNMLVKEYQRLTSELNTQQSQSNNSADSLNTRLLETEKIAKSGLRAESEVILSIHNRLASFDSSLKEVAAIARKSGKAVPGTMKDGELERSEAFTALHNQVQDMLQGNSNRDDVVIQHVDEQLERGRETTDLLNKKADEMSSAIGILESKLKALNDLAESRIPSVSSPRVPQVSQQISPTTSVVSVSDRPAHRPQNNIQPPPTTSAGSSQQSPMNHQIFQYPQPIQGMQYINQHAQTVHFPVPAQGQPMPAQGQPIPNQGQPIPNQGQPIPNQGQPMSAQGQSIGLGQPHYLQQMAHNAILQQQQRAAQTQPPNLAGSLAQSPAPKTTKTVKELAAKVSTLENTQKAYEHGIRSATARLDKLVPDQIINSAVATTLQHLQDVKIGPLENAHGAISANVQKLIEKQTKLEQTVKQVQEACSKLHTTDDLKKLQQSLKDLADNFNQRFIQIDNVVTSHKTDQENNEGSINQLRNELSTRLESYREDLNNTVSRLTETMELVQIECATQVAETAESCHNLEMDHQALKEEMKGLKNARTSKSGGRSTSTNPTTRSPRTPISNANETGENQTPDRSDSEHQAANLLKQFQASSPAKPNSKPSPKKLLSDKTNEHLVDRSHSNSRVIRQIPGSGDDTSDDEPLAARAKRQAPVDASKTSTPLSSTSAQIKAENQAPTIQRTHLMKRKKTAPIEINGSDPDNSGDSSSVARKKTKTPTPAR